jgi:hypothetical protein
MSSFPGMRVSPRTRLIASILSIELLEEAGPPLGRPHVDTLRTSKIANLKELLVQHDGRPLRILFAFDPRGKLRSGAESKLSWLGCHWGRFVVLAQ